MSSLGGSNELRIPLQLSKGCVIASIQIDLSESVLTQLRADLLQFIQESNASGVIVDVTGVDVMDANEFEALRLTLDMTRLMGARYVLVGLNAGIVSTLVQVKAHTEGLETAVSLDEAYNLLSPNDLIPEGDEQEEPIDVANRDQLVNSKTNEVGSEAKGVK